MNRTLLASLVALFVFSTMYSTSFAKESTQSSLGKTVERIEKLPPQDGEFGKHHDGDFQKFRPSKEEMEKKKAEIDKRLNLTEEQKAAIEKNRNEGHEKVKPIFEQTKAKHKEIEEVKNDNDLTEDQKKEKIDKLKQEITTLKEQANTYRQENMNAFEAILDDNQKKEFAKIKEEQKQEMEKRKAEFKNKKNKGKKNNKRAGEFPPSQPPIFND